VKSIFDESAPTDRLTPRQKSLRITLGTGLLVLLYAMGTTLAANINIGTGTSEFGQGIQVTTACDNQITVTPQASFNNAATPSPATTPNTTGVFYLSSIKVASIDSSANGCDGKWMTLKSFDSNSSTPLQLIDGALSFSVLNTAGVFSSTQSGFSVSTQDTSTFTITFTTPVALAREVTRVTIETSSALPAQMVVTYSVGDTGPGGGIIYYVDANGFNCGSSFTSTGSPTGGLCKYLEVALNTWDGDAGTPVDPRKQLIVNSGLRNDNPGIVNEATAYNNAASIGLGYKNTLAIIQVENNAANAAATARAFTGGGKNDWYLPTTSELNLLCQWARGVTQNVAVKCSGGNNNKIWDLDQNITNGASDPVSFNSFKAYWTSSEDSGLAWVQYLNSSGNQDLNGRGDGNNVRPIRAF
jgi:hypothetical protein